MSIIADANVLLPTRLMRLFTDQLEALAKLKGKTGQQRVVVEHGQSGRASHRWSRRRRQSQCAQWGGGRSTRWRMNPKQRDVVG